MSRTDAVGNLLGLLRADPAFVAWAKAYPSLDAAWEACADPARMLWLLRSLGYGERAVLRRFAVACARRVAGPLGEGACARALELASRVAEGLAAEEQLGSAYREARTEAARLSERTDFGESLAAAALSCAAAVRASPMVAAEEASREALRAVTWDPAAQGSTSEEARWQAAELRRLTEGTIQSALDGVRASRRGKLSLV